MPDRVYFSAEDAADTNAKDALIRDELRRQVIRAYGSLTSPTWHLIQARHDARPYAELEASLRARFVVRDTTDLNDDVALILEVDGTEREWVLFLSYVAPVAAVLALTGERRLQVLAHASGDADETLLFTLLEQHGLTALSQSTLEQPIELTLSNTLPGRVKLFQALFTDCDILPWIRP